MKPVLKSFGMAVMEILDDSAIIDGGDVMFTGKEIFVGISKRTNHAGAAAVAEAFPGYRVHRIKVSGPLHLITRMGLCGEDTICISDETGDSIAMFEVSKRTNQSRVRCYGLACSRHFHWKQQLVLASPETILLISLRAERRLRQFLAAKTGRH